MDDQTLTPERFVETVANVLRHLKIGENRTTTQAITLKLGELAKTGTPGTLVLDRERLNILLAAWHLGPVCEEFLDYYGQGSITDVVQLRDGLQKFVKDALWHFGSIERAFEFLRTCKSIWAFLCRNEHDQDQFGARLPWKLLTAIPPEDRGYLGYVSGRRPFEEDRIADVGEAVLRELEAHRSDYEGCSPEEVEELLVPRLAEKVTTLREDLQKVKELEASVDLFNYQKLEDNKASLTAKRTQIRKLIERIDELRRIGRANLEEYLSNLSMMDVYVATSMRNDREYQEMYEFVKSVFSDPISGDTIQIVFQIWPVVCFPRPLSGGAVLSILGSMCPKPISTFAAFAMR